MAGTKNGNIIAMVLRLNKGLFFLLASLLISKSLAAQNIRSVVFFKDKNATTYSLEQPEAFLSSRAIERRSKQKIKYDSTDLPVTAVYLTAIQDKGAKVLYPFKWLNAVLIEANTAQLSEILQLSFVKDVTSYQTLAIPVARQSIESDLTAVTMRTEAQSGFYGVATAQLEMLSIPKIHKSGYRGEGMLVAVFDGGFSNANTIHAFDSLFLNNRVKATFDLVDMETNVFDNNQHGTAVLSCMAACDTGKMVGGAYRADYLLFRTEIVTEETPLEEYYWLRASEMADSAGVDVINSSLGYNTFDNSSYSHTYSQLDGKTTVVSKAASFAAQKGMIVVNSAGNEGNTSWRHINTPADTPDVLTVGAVDLNGNHASFSSVGPTADGRIKPDVVAPGAAVYVADPHGSYLTGTGTSYAAPTMAGLVVTFWQKNPDLTNLQVIDYLKRSGSRAGTPDYKYGYGIPAWDRADDLITLLKDNKTILNKFKIYPNPIADQEVVLEVDMNQVSLPFHVELYDNYGKKVFEQFLKSASIFNNLSLNCITLTPGCYFFKVIDGDGNVFLQKILKI